MCTDALHSTVQGNRKEGKEKWEGKRYGKGGNGLIITHKGHSGTCSERCPCISLSVYGCSECQ